MAINPKIKQKAAGIRTKVFGSEVRESLASGLEGMSEDVESIKGRQGNVESQFQDVLDETTGKDVISAPELIAARNGEANLKTRLDKENQDLTAQLQQTKNFQDYEIQNKTRNTQALFTIVDDDGRVEVLTQLEPLRAEFNIPMCTAIVSQWVGWDGYMTKEQIIDLESKGWEIMSHTNNHEMLSDFSYGVQDDTMKRSVDTLTSWGLDVKNIAYPYGARNDNTVKSARKYFRSGRSTDFGINRTPLQTWDITLINGEGAEKTVSAIKARIDDIAENGGWGVYLTHAGLGDDIPTTHVREIIEYVLSKGNIEFVTHNEALNRMGNIIDNGRYWEKDLSKPHGVVGADGTIRTNESLSQILMKEDSVSNDTPPSAFTLGKTYVTRILYANRTGFPESLHGTLVTNLQTVTNVNLEYATQTYYPVKSPFSYTRYAVSISEWSEWKSSSLSSVDNSVKTPTSLPNDYSEGVTYYLVPYTARAGWPTDRAGSVMTHRIKTYIYQIFVIYGKANIVYMRTAATDTNTWDEWVRISPMAVTTGERAGLSVDYLVTGEMVFDRTLNKPLWRNASNNGWVDANGTSV